MQTLRPRFTHRNFTGEPSGKQHSWGCEESRKGQVKVSVMQLQQRPLVGALELEWPALQHMPELRQGSNHAFALCTNQMLAASCPQDEGLVLGDAAPLHRGQPPNKNIVVAAEGWISQSRRGTGGVAPHPLHTCTAIRSAWRTVTHRNYSILKATAHFTGKSHKG